MKWVALVGFLLSSFMVWAAITDYAGDSPAWNLAGGLIFGGMGIIFLLTFLYISAEDNGW